MTEKSTVAVSQSKWFSDQLVHVTSGSNNINFNDTDVLNIISLHLWKSDNRRKEMLEPYKDHMNKILENLSNLKNETHLNFDTSKHKIREAFCKAINHSLHTPLHNIHKNCNNDQGKKGNRLEKFNLVKNLLETKIRHEFQQVYEDLVMNVILPNAYNACGESEVYYQAFPCIRIVRPKEFSIGIHADVNYGFNPANVNYYIPLTDLRGSSSLHVESSPGREDWHTLDYKYGDIYRFHGAMCSHFTTENMSDRTRLSLDFRVIPASLFKIIDDHYSTSDGYYVKAKISNGKWCRIDPLPIPDARNGFPFTKK